jgi:CSLREA domain-containing protein
MRTTTLAPRRHRSRYRDGRVLGRLSAIVVVMIVTAACHDDAMKLHPVAPSSPGLAVSSDGTWLVNSLADPGDGSCTNSECTLREALAAAQNGERITFKSNLSGTIALTAGHMVVDKLLTIAARDPGQVTVNAQGASGVFRIVGGSGTLVTLSGLTITGGGGPNGSGIEVFANNTLTLVGSVVTGNTATSGGGLHIRPGGMARVIGSTIAANVVTFSGGGIYSQGNLTVSRSTISGNTADFEGGGIGYDCSDIECTNLVLTSSTITRNDAPNGGGLHILSAYPPPIIANTIIAGNLPIHYVDPTADCKNTVGFTDFGYNLTTAGTGCELTSPTSVIVAVPSQVFLSVLMPVLAENGSPRPTHALIERGYAVDAGYCPGETGDQRGFPRPYDDTRMPNALDACDIGAFEWHPVDTKGKGPKP